MKGSDSETKSVPLDQIAPRSVQMDASSHCQLACPVCPTADGRTKPVLGAGHLKVADFEALLDRNPEILHVELSNYGEMFLNPNLPEILAAANRRGVVVSGSNGVNLNFAREEALEAVVRHGVRSLTCSIDGATQATYVQYRRNGNLENVLRHVDRIIAHKKRLRTGFPILYWQFVVFGHNEHELEAARRMAEQRGMEFVPRLSWDAELSPVGNAELVHIQTGLGAATREEYKEKNGVDYTRDICYQLWRAPVVNWDGKLLGCCVNYWGDFGSNVFREGLAQSAGNPKMRQARAMLTGESPAVPGIPCTTCDQYESLRASGKWLTEAEIASAPDQPRILSLLPEADGDVRFARISVYSQQGEGAGGPGATQAEVVGRLFRFGVDHAVYCSPPEPGDYQADVEVLTSTGWRRGTFPFQVPERPICTNVVLDLRNWGSPAEPAGRIRHPSWVR